jgi:hypothetical protein
MRAKTTGMIMVILAVGVSACGGSNGDAGSTETGGSPGGAAATSPATTATTPPEVSGSDACTLVTQDEAAEVLGSSVPPPSEDTFSIPVGGTTLEEQVCLFGSQVLVARFDLGGVASALFDQYRASLQSESDFEEVSGVGEEAFFAKGQLALRQGETGLIVDVGQNLGTTPDEQEKEKALAAIAIGRL